MGTIIELKQFRKEELLLSQLIVYSKSLQLHEEVYSVGKILADKLLSTKESRRSVKLEQLFNETLDEYLDGAIICDIDILFNPNYKIDVLKVLIAARKRKQYCVIWPGKFEDEKLIYGEEGYLDYKVFNTADYDITFIR